MQFQRSIPGKDLPIESSIVTPLLATGARPHPERRA